MSGALSMLMSGGVSFPLAGTTVSDSNTGAASAGWYLRTTGLVDTSTTLGGTISGGGGSWATGVFNPSLYEALVTPTSGTMSSGTVSPTAVSLASDQTWLVTQVGAGTKSCVATVVIRYAGGGATLATASITLTALAA